MSTLVQRSVLDASGFPLDQIQILGIAARGFHGVLESEREAGQDFSADVTLYLDTRAAARDDDLDETVNYALVAQDVVDILSGEPVDLIETVAEQIAAAILDRPLVASVDVTVHKPQAPIPVPFSDVTVTINRDRLNVPVVTSPVAPALDEIPLVVDEPEAVPAPLPVAVPVPADLPEAFEPVALRVDEVDDATEPESPKPSASPTLDLPLGVLTAPVAAREADPASYGASELHLESDLVRAEDDAPGSVDAGPVPPVAAAALAASPLDAETLAEQARRSEEVRRPEVFGLRPRTEVHDRPGTLSAAEALPDADEASSVAGEAPSVADEAPSVADPVTTASASAAGEAGPTGGPQPGAAFFAAASAAVLNASRDRTPVSFEELLNPGAQPPSSSPAASRDSDGTAAGDTAGAAAPAGAAPAATDGEDLPPHDEPEHEAPETPGSAHEVAPDALDPAPAQSAPSADEEQRPTSGDEASAAAEERRDDSEPVVDSGSTVGAVSGADAVFETSTDETSSDDLRTDEPPTGEPRTDEPRTDELWSDEPRTDELWSDEPQTDETPTDDLRIDETQVFAPVRDESDALDDDSRDDQTVLDAEADLDDQVAEADRADQGDRSVPEVPEAAEGGVTDVHSDSVLVAHQEEPAVEPAVSETLTDDAQHASDLAGLDPTSTTAVLEPVQPDSGSEPSAAVEGDADDEPGSGVSSVRAEGAGLVQPEPTETPETGFAETETARAEATETGAAADPVRTEGVDDAPEPTVAHTVPAGHEPDVDQLATPTSPIPVVVPVAADGAPQDLDSGPLDLEAGTQPVTGPFGDLSDPEDAHQMPLQLDRMDARPDEPVEAVLALGANLGDAQGTLRRAVAELGTLTGVDVVEVGPLARTAAVGGPEQPDFLNTVVIVRTTLSPRELMLGCQSVESGNGRVRDVRWGPRTLDIDIVVYGDVIGSAPDLELPHPRANERAFVLAPWAHLSPEAHLPGLGGGPVAALAATAHDREGIRWLALDWLHDAEVPTAATARRPATVAPALTAVQVVSVPQATDEHGADEGYAEPGDGLSTFSEVPTGQDALEGDQPTDPIEPTQPTGPAEPAAEPDLWREDDRPASPDRPS